MVKEDYVSFEVAELLKEKGFKGQGEHFYEDNKITNHPNYWFRITPIERYEAIEAPTLQMAMKWLREERKIGIEVNIIFDLNDDNKWYYEYGFCILQLSGTYKKIAECDYDGYKTYEEACEAAIKYVLENLI